MCHKRPISAGFFRFLIHRMATATEFPAANIEGANLRFPSDQYVTMANIPVFRAHATKARDGRTLKFDQTTLTAVCNRCNRRIAETGDYAAIVIGHTSDPGEENSEAPELVGYAGPFRMGTIGEGDRKCWTILADFHIMRDCMAQVRKHPRRSPELCLEDSYDEMFLDPIALLGAEVPRLDLGLLTGAQGSDGSALPAPEGTAKHLYSFVRNGRTVEKYAMAACASPAASNVFAPQKADIETPKPKKYAADNTPGSEPDKDTIQQQTHQHPKPETASMLTPEDISAVVEAFLATDAGQFLVSEMRAKQGTNAIVEPTQEPPADEIQPAEDEIETQPAAEVPPPQVDAEPAEKPAPEAAPKITAHPEPDGDETGKEDVRAKKYAAACDAMDAHSDEDVEKYLKSRKWNHKANFKKYGAEESASIEGEENPKVPEGEVTNKTGDPSGDDSIKAKHLPAMEKPTEKEPYSRLAARVAALESQKRHIERYSRLQAKSGQFIMDPDDEIETTKDMTDAQFDRHVNKTIPEHYQRNPVGLPWPVPENENDYQAEPSNGRAIQALTPALAAKATERYQRARAEGKTVDYATILEEVKAGR